MAVRPPVNSAIEWLGSELSFPLTVGIFTWGKKRKHSFLFLTAGPHFEFRDVPQGPLIYRGSQFQREQITARDGSRDIHVI